VSRPGAPLAERLLAGLGAVVLLAVLGALLREAWVQPEDPLPRITLSIDRTEQEPGGWLVVVDVVNEGALAALDVTLEASLAEGEWHRIQLAELPPRGEERVAFRFDREPVAGQVSLRVGGFTLP
jgi:uncharacterized protein (TIGR02588 family)